MKLHTLLFALFAFLPAAQAASTVQIHFGQINGVNHHTNPTRVQSIPPPTEEPGIGLIGKRLYWACLDLSAPTPEGSGNTYNVDTTGDVLRSGIWDNSDTAPSGNIPEGQDRTAILNAVKNIYYNFEAEILADTSSFIENGDGAGEFFQMACWSLTEGYVDGSYEVLDTDAIEILVDSSGIDHPMFADMMKSAFDDSKSSGRPVYYAGLPSGETLQGVILFEVPTSIPEPSSLLLLGIAGVLGLRRRRN